MHYVVLLSLWTTALALIVDFVGLTGALFYRAAGSVSSVKPTYSSLCTSDQPVIYSAESCAVLRVCFRVYSRLFLGLFCVGVAPL